MFLQYILLFVKLIVVLGVNRDKFKQCSQSGFCKRAFETPLVKNRYNYNSDSLSCKDGIIMVKMKDEILNTTLLVSILALENNRIRFKAIEADPLYPRYDVFQNAWKQLQDEPKINSSVETVLNTSPVTCQFKFSSGYSLITHLNPFIVTIFDDKNEKVVSLNEQEAMYLEPHLHSQKRGSTVIPPTNSQGNEINANEQTDLDVDADIERGRENSTDGKEAEKSTIIDIKESFDGHTDSVKRGFQAVSFDATFHDFKNLYGLAEHADHFSLNVDEKDPYRLFNLDVFEYELYNRMALYGSVPYIIGKNSNQSIGLLFLNPSELWVSISKKQQNKIYSFFGYVKQDVKNEIHTRWVAESGIIDVYIMMGPLPSDTTYQYSLTTGFQQLPPMFSIAYHQSRWNYIDQKDVEEVNSNFNYYHIPFDVIWLDIDHTPDRKYFLWNTHKFPDSLSMIQNLTDSGRKLVTIVDPHVSKSSDYFIQKEGTEFGYFVRNANNNTYDGWCWPGNSVYPDFLHPKVREWWASKFSTSIYKGTTKDVYTWIDMNEPSVFNGPEVTIPKDVQHGDWENRDIHNLYGQMYHEAAFNGGLIRSDNHLRPFVLTRAFFAGSQKYGAAWTGDNKASWDHLQITVPMLLSLSVSGIHFCGADVGGFFSNPDDELHIRWFQAGSMQPFFRGHSHTETKRREFWLFSEKTRESLKQQVLRRYKYLPYIYTLFHISHTYGTPVMRPLWFDFHTDPHALLVEDAYLLGTALLIKPIVTPNTNTITVYFPTNSAGDTVWWDSSRGSSYPGNKNISITYKNIDELPMFQLGGTIIPTWNRLRRSSSKMMNDPITLYIALDLAGKANGEIYFDDGSSVNHAAGEYSICYLNYSDGKLTSNFTGNYVAKNWLERVIIVGNGLKQLTRAIITTTESSTNVTKKLVVQPLNDHSILIRKPGVKFVETFAISLQ